MVLLLFPFSQLPAFAQFSLEKVKEFEINSLNQVNIVDFHPVKGLYLGYITMGTDILEIALIDEEGKIIRQRNLRGDGPEKYNSTMNSLGFSDNGDIWILTVFELLQYDQNLNLKERIRFEPKVQVYLYGRASTFAHFYKNGSNSGLHFVSHPSEASKFLGKKNFDNTYLLDVYNVTGKNYIGLAPVTKRPLFSKMEPSVFSGSAILFFLDRAKNLVYVTTSLDNEITVINLANNQVVSRIPVRHGAFKSLTLKQIDFSNLSSHGRVTLEAKNHKLVKPGGDYLVLDYIREIPFGTYEKKLADDPYYHHFKDPDYHRMIVFDQNNQVSGDLRFPYGQLMIGMPDDSILIKLENPETEEDFIRYGIFKIKKNGE